MQIQEPVDSGNLRIQVALLLPGETAPEGFFFDYFKKDGSEVWIKFLGPSTAMQKLYSEALTAA